MCEGGQKECYLISPLSRQVKVKSQDGRLEGEDIERWEPACKPGSVVNSHSSAMSVTGHLKRPTRERCGPHHCPPIWSCSGWGLPSHRVLPPARCALTAPFQPYLCSRKSHRRYVFCCTFRRLTPPRRYLAPCPVEPGLSSIFENTAAARPTPGP